MISISIFRINAKDRTIWYNLIQTPRPRENFLDPRMPNTIFQNLFFFKIITSLANIFSNLFSQREILGFFFFFYFNTSFHSIYVTTF